MADCLQLVDELRAAEQLRHRAERQTAEVLVEPGRDDSCAALDEHVDHEHDLRREELHLVDADHVVALPQPRDVLGPRDRDGAHLRPCVADDVADVVAVVDLRLHDQRPLAGDLGAAEPPNELFALAGEHRAADHLEPAAVLGEQANHGR